MKPATEPVPHHVVAITGASGAVYALQLIRALLAADQRVSLMLSAAGRQVMEHETGLALAEEIDDCRRQVQDHFASIAIDCVALDDFTAAMASGTGAPDTMIVVPCSMGTVGRIAAGVSGNLLERTADVMLKERRPLLLVPRETPLNNIHLENLLRLSRAGAVILPAMPGFYHGVESVDGLVDFVVGKILDQLGIPHDLVRPWGAAETDRD